MSQSAYEIKTPLITLRITIMEISRLHIHEEIIPEILLKLAEKIKHDGVFRDPVIVDEKTLVVLDGMHRVASIKHLGLKYIPVCLVDYDNPNINLYSWSRVVKQRQTDLDEARKLLLNSITKLGLRIVNIPDLDKGLGILSRRELTAIISLGRTNIGVKSRSREIKIIYDDVKRIEEATRVHGFEIEYYTEKDALELVNSNKAVATIIPPTITKKEVRDVALRGEVFIHKATRHVIPARPVGVNVPLAWLSGSYPLNEVQRMLVEYLSNRKLRTLPPGSILDRRYEEELYVFE
ncbi:MAG: ParB N-terminal domain-containing protein [Desulfurococcaceae archaeon]